MKWQSCLKQFVLSVFGEREVVNQVASNHQEYIALFPTATLIKHLMNFLNDSIGVLFLGDSHDYLTEADDTLLQRDVIQTTDLFYQQWHILVLQLLNVQKRHTTLNFFVYFEHYVVFVLFLWEFQQPHQLLRNLNNQLLQRLVTFLLLFHNHDLSVDGIDHQIHVVQESGVCLAQFLLLGCSVGLLIQLR